MHRQSRCVGKESDYNEKDIQIESLCNFTTSNESDYSFICGDGVIDKEMHDCLFIDVDMYTRFTPCHPKYLK